MRYYSLLFTLAGFIVVLSIFLTIFKVVLADTNPACPTVYGAACPAGALFLDKKVQHLKTGEFVDTLSAADVTFPPSQEVNFKIEVKNTGAATLNSIQVQDKLPAELNFISLSVTGNFDSNSRTVNWTIDTLNPGESRFFQIKGQVKPQNELPQTDTLCVSNFAQAKKDVAVASDSAVLCIQTQALKVAPVTELPKTGPKELVYLLLVMLPLGLILKKLAQGSSSTALVNFKDPMSIWQKRKFLKDQD